MESDGSTRDIEIYTGSGVVRAKPYSSGAAALVFVCSIIGDLAPSYEVDGIGGRFDSEPEVPTLLYIGRRGRVQRGHLG